VSALPEGTYRAERVECYTPNQEGELLSFSPTMTAPINGRLEDKFVSDFQGNLLDVRIDGENCFVTTKYWVELLPKDVPDVFAGFKTLEASQGRINTSNGSACSAGYALGPSTGGRITPSRIEFTAHSGDPGGQFEAKFALLAGHLLVESGFKVEGRPGDICFIDFVGVD
jgi:hypothetical protein